jgi:hypothetical protein
MGLFKISGSKSLPFRGDLEGLFYFNSASNFSFNFT